MPTVVRSERRKDRRSVPVRVVVRLLLLLVAAFVFADTTVGDRGLIAVFHAEREYTALVSELDRLKGQNSQLREEIRRLREDPAAIEELARRDLGLMRPGEKVFIIRDAAPATPLDAPESSR
jgi:cell division protein FtsB